VKEEKKKEKEKSYSNNNRLDSGSETGTGSSAGLTAELTDPMASMKDRKGLWTMPQSKIYFNPTLANQKQIFKRSKRQNLDFQLLVVSKHTTKFTQVYGDQPIIDLTAKTRISIF
jgi:hypothetical protein